MKLKEKKLRNNLRGGKFKNKRSEIKRKRMEIKNKERENKNKGSKTKEKIKRKGDGNKIRSVKVKKISRSGKLNKNSIKNQGVRK